MRTVDLDELESELQSKGTDERFVRAVMILARHVNRALEGSSSDIDDRIDERIQRDRERCERQSRYDY
jgi:hypothetical protein